MYQVDQGAYWQAQTMYWGPKILIAILILVATWVVARAVAWVLKRAIDRSPALKKHVTGTPEETVGHQLGTIAKLIIWLVGIMAALRFLGIGQILSPINDLVTQIFTFLPRLIGAGLIFFVGLILARIVKRLVETVLIAANPGEDRNRIDRGDGPDGTGGGSAGRGARFDAREPRSCGWRARLRADHHSDLDCRAAGARDRVHLGPGDGDAQPNPDRHPARRCGRGLARHRIHCGAFPQDDH